MKINATATTSLLMLLATMWLEQAGAAPPARLLFRAGFEGASVAKPEECWDTGCWQDIAGNDRRTGFRWPPRLRGGTGRFLLIADPVKTNGPGILDYMHNRVELVDGPDGARIHALYQEISKTVNGVEPMGGSAAQNEFQFLPLQNTDELYVSYWIKLQPDLVSRMTNLPPGPGIGGGGTWRAIFAFKTGSQRPQGGPANDGDYRVEAYVMTYGSKTPYWTVLGDNNAGGNAPLTNDWHIENRSLPVPLGRWFKFEIYWRRANDETGRVWAAVDGHTIADRRGPNMGARNLPINRIMAPMLYTGQRMPAYQWIDDVQVWSGMPSSSRN
jgi:hypothetical protein